MAERMKGGSKQGGKRARTRAALIEAALGAIEDRGFAGASLDEIAARAGMTKGAIYSNFSGKADLLLAVMAARGLTLAATEPRSATIGDELGSAAEALVGVIERARGEARLLAEFQLFALSDPEIRAGLARSYAESFAGVADYLAKLEGASALDPRELAVALQSVSLGLLLQSTVTPGEVTPKLVRETFAALARGLAAPGR